MEIFSEAEIFEHDLAAQVAWLAAIADDEDDLQCFLDEIRSLQAFECRGEFSPGID